MTCKACYVNLYKKASETVIMGYDCLWDLGFQLQGSNNILQIRIISASSPVNVFYGIQA